MEPSVFLTWAETPSEPCSASPPGACHTLSWLYVHAEPAVPVRYLVKLSVVPELSARCTGVIAVDGRVTPGLSAAMAGSFQVLMVPEKMPASVAGLNCRLVAPLTLVTTAIGPTTMGRWIATPEPQCLFALGWSVAESGESEPAKSAVPAMNACWPAPEPVPW